MAAGARVASPAPTPMRARNNAPSDRVAPQTAVITLHNATPPSNSRLRLVRSARRPASRPTRASGTAKASPDSKPNSVSVIPKSRRSWCPATVTIARSKLPSALALASAPTAMRVSRRPGHGVVPITAAPGARGAPP